jgi:hypothetical protein
MRCFAVVLFLSVLLTGDYSLAEDIPFERLRRLYDFTPSGPDNPVLARVTECAIEIPVSEFRVYVIGQMRDGASPGSLTPGQRRQYLERLLDEHFLLWSGYQQQADKTPGMIRTLKQTQNMLLQEALIQQEVGAKAHSREEYLRLVQKLCDDLFGKTQIKVSNEVYATLKAAAGACPRGAQVEATAARGPSAQRISSSQAPDGIPAQVRDLPLATCKLGVVTLGDFLAAYQQIPLEKRPDLDRQESVSKILQQLLSPGLLIAEAWARGLEKSPLVREKLQLNRNVLTRLYAIDQLTAQAAAQMKAPDLESHLKQWFESHRHDLYAVKDKNRKDWVLTFEAEKERIANDYFEDLQERMRAAALRDMRAARSIEIDDKLVEKAFQ